MPNCVGRLIRLGAKVNISLVGKTHQVSEGATGFDLFELREVIAMQVNGEARDLSHVVAENDEVEGILIDSPAGLEILRHSTAHVMAQAVQELFPDARLGIGPYITDGFYFDFDVLEPFVPEDIKRIEKRMKELVGKSQRFTRLEVSDEEARKLMANEPYKLELIGLKSEDVAEGSVEVSAGGLSVYENINPDGSFAWRDLCRGPHLPNTRQIGKNFSLLRSAAAYWRGNENNKQLQRIYGTAWATKEALAEHLENIDQAAKRDHRKLGAELDLFSFPEEIGSGLAVFHPKGGIIRRVMEDYSRTRHEEAGYEFVYSPHITKSNLFEQSGHLNWYSDGMFPPMKLDSEIGEDGEIRKQGVDYYLKPMNCPFHILIFKSRSRSYRELPIRMFEFGSVYRYEKSGVLHGLTRVRGMTQDDAHLFVTQDQLREELISVLKFVLDLLRDYGLNDFYLELSTREGGNPKFVGEDAIWEAATNTLEQVAKESGLELVPDPGGAAFYGPKISIQARDAIGRTWQMSTIQLDFNLPERFGLEYVGSDGARHQPIMIHRALFGSIERFFAVLTEHYAGHFPPWLAPVQAVGIPVADEFAGYLDEFAASLKKHGVRISVDHSDNRMQKKIRDHTLDKVPFIFLAGARDVEAGTVALRYRDGTERNDIALEEARQIILQSIANKEQV
jgi:threonyl-tRNA synthetase